MKEEFTFHYDGLSGAISVTLPEHKSLDDFCARFIPEYTKERFEAVGLRFFTGKETVITVYALDKIRHDNSKAGSSRLPVKKFKLSSLPPQAFAEFVKEINFTLSTGLYQLDDMEVVNR